MLSDYDHGLQNCQGIIKFTLDQKSLLRCVLQERECTEKFKKDCTIQYKSVPKSERVETCRRQMSRDCDAEGDIICTNEQETSRMNLFLY